MTKKLLIAAAGAGALTMVAFASSQPASAAMTPMPPASKPHPYTPDLRPNASNAPKTYSPYTKLPPGSLTRDQQRQQQQQQQQEGKAPSK